MPSSPTLAPLIQFPVRPRRRHPGPRRFEPASAPPAAPRPLAVPNPIATRPLAPSADFPAVVAELVRGLLGLRAVVFARADPDTRRFVAVALHTAAGSSPLPITTASLLSELCNRCLVDAVAPTVIHDAQHDPCLAGAPVRRALGIRGYVGIPIVGADGTSHGLLCALDRRPFRGAPGVVDAAHALAGLIEPQLLREQAAQLQGALVAARAVQRHVRSALASASLQARQLDEDPALPAQLRGTSQGMRAGVRHAETIVARLRCLRQLRQKRWGPLLEPTLDLGLAT